MRFAARMQVEAVFGDEAAAVRAIAATVRSAWNRIALRS